MDFAFGTLSTDTLKLYHHRLSRQGVRHAHKLYPRKPKAFEAMTLYATTGAEVDVDYVACYYSTDGSEPTGCRGAAEKAQVAAFEKVETFWDSLVWGYVNRWRVVLAGLPEGTRLRYRIGAWSGGGEEIFADYPDTKISSENAADRHFNQNLPPDATIRWGEPQPGTVFTLKVGQPGAPAWAKDAIIYHLMVDRFYPGDGNAWHQKADLTTYCGGTLKGVEDKLEYIASLGVNSLWLSPMYQVASYHGYDAVDYTSVHPRFGDKNDLHKLVDKAHERGIKVLFDLACNHVSNQHPLFQKALSDSRSPYRDWFAFDTSVTGYRGFFGVESMPEVNLTHPDARDWMIDNALYWLKHFDIDGYRLDYAGGARPDFWSYFVEACKNEKADTFYFGEIIEPPDMLQAYVGRLDGVLDFQVNYALRQTYAWKAWSEKDLDRFLARHQHYFPEDFVRPVFVDNHDMDRFFFSAQENRETQLRALQKLLSLPHPPVIYAGTEVGMSQCVSTKEGGYDASRLPMYWGKEQDKVLLENTRALIRSRGSHNT